MLVTSQLPIQTTKISLVFLACTCAPPHFEKGPGTCDVPTPLLLALHPWETLVDFSKNFSRGGPKKGEIWLFAARD